MSAYVCVRARPICNFWAMCGEKANESVHVNALYSSPEIR